jgi:hypothetical protein
VVRYAESSEGAADHANFTDDTVEAAVSAALHQMQVARPFDFAQGRLRHYS